MAMACSSKGTTPRADGGFDATADGAADAATDTLSPPDASAPDATPDATPDAMADAMPDAIPDATSDAAADATADATSDAATDATPDATSDAAADAAADAAVDATSDAAADATSDAAADATSDAAADAGPPGCSTDPGVDCTGTTLDFIERPYAFVDISTTGIVAPMASAMDDGADAVDLPFAFPMLGSRYCNAHISSNGFLQLGAADSATNYTNTTIPEPTEPNRLVAPLWDDLDPSAAGTVYYEERGTAPNRTYIVQWHDVQFLSRAGIGNVTFQLILHENGAIEFQYEMINETHDRHTGSSATVGIENDDGTAGVLHSFDTAGSVGDNMNLTLSCPLPPLPPI